MMPNTWQLNWNTTVLLDNPPLMLDDYIDVARHGAQVQLSGQARAAVEKTGRLIDRWLKDGRTIYGVTTGFGALRDVSISRQDAERLQVNILMSHAAGVGAPLDEAAVRGIMLLRAKELSQGHSCGRVASIDQLIALLNRGAYPLIPAQGSVGASGDLCPMAHMALLLIGKGEGFIDERRLPGKEVLDACHLVPLGLEPGEGLALINGTQVMTAIGALAVHDAVRLAKHH